MVFSLLFQRLRNRPVKRLLVGWFSGAQPTGSRFFAVGCASLNHPPSSWLTPAVCRTILFFCHLAFTNSGVGDDTPGRLTVAAKLQAKSAYVGQALELQVAVVAGAKRPIVEIPKVAGADVAFLGVETQAITVSAIDDQVREQTVHRFRYRLIPRKAGVIIVPAVQATLDAAKGTSTPIELKARELPREGRTGDFLGGVGTFELSSRAEPTLVRLGQEFEFVIEVKGAAARGMREVPSLERLTRTHPGIRVEPRDGTSIDEPPSRTFTWKIRPKSSGDLRISPVSIAAFDLKSGRYATKATAGIAVKVIDVPAFDPKTIDYRVQPETRGLERGGSEGWGRALGTLGLIGLIAVATRYWRRRWRSGANASRRAWKSIEDRLGGDLEGNELGPMINQVVKDYLISRQAWSTGALTPIDAKIAVARLTHSTDLADRAEALLEHCDRLCFSGRIGDEDFARIKREALEFLKDMIMADRGR